MKKNHAKSLKYIKQAAENKANLILFPEVQLTEFFPQHEGREVSEYRLSINSEEIKAFQAQLKLKMSNKQKMAEIQNESDENQPDNNPIIDLPSYDIPESKFYNKYLENEKTLDLDNLRREREIEIKRKW